MGLAPVHQDYNGDQERKVTHLRKKVNLKEKPNNVDVATLQNVNMVPSNLSFFYSLVSWTKAIRFVHHFDLEIDKDDDDKHEDDDDDDDHHYLDDDDVKEDDDDDD